MLPSLWLEMKMSAIATSPMTPFIGFWLALYNNFLPKSSVNFCGNEKKHHMNEVKNKDTSSQYTCFVS